MMECEKTTEQKSHESYEKNLNFTLFPFLPRSFLFFLKKIKVIQLHIVDRKCEKLNRARELFFNFSFVSFFTKKSHIVRRDLKI